MKKDWLWDKDIPETELKKVFADRNNPRFISLAALLLSRKNSAEEVFKEYIKQEDFFVRWQSIKRRMRKNSWNDPRIEYWQAIYDTLKKRAPALGGLKRSQIEEPLFTLPREIGEKIKEVREGKGWTQKKLADKLGISQQIISRIESGMHNISLATLDKVCRGLGMLINAEKLGLQVEPETIDKTLNVLPFSAKSPEEFVKAVYEIINRLNEFNRVQYYDGMGDKQRDIIAYKYEVGTKQQWYFQCKRYTKKIGFSIFENELNKIAEHSRKDKDYRPDVIVFATACRVGIPTIDKVKDHAKKIGLGEVIFWTDIELTAKAKAAGIYEDLFPVTCKNLKESSEDIKKHVTNLFSNAGLLIEQDKSKNDEINRIIDEAVQNIKSNNIDKAKQILLNVEGKIEDNPVKFKEELARIYNDLGVCYNRFERDGGDFDEAVRYFQIALEIKPDFIKAKINLSSLHLNKGSEKDFEEAYNIAEQLWKRSDKRDSTIFEIFIWSKYQHQSPQKVIDFYENSKEAQELVKKDEKLSSLMGTIYLNEKNIDKSQELIEQALNLAPHAPRNLMLKARILMARAETETIIPSVFEVIPKFKRYEEIEKALGLLGQALEIAEKEKNDFLVNQIRYDINFCLLWFWRFEAAEYKENRESIDVKRLTPDQQMQLGINDVFIQIQRRNFETAYDMLIATKGWVKLSYQGKTRIAHIFFLRGGSAEAKNILKTLESEADQKKDIQFWLDMSLNEVLLNNKNLAINAAEKAKNFSIGTDKEKMVLSHFNALMLRYADSGEVERLMAGMFDYDRKYPEDKALWSVKAVDGKGGLSDEFKGVFFKQKEWYEGVMRTFRSQPVPSYYLEQILKRPYAQILSFQKEPELAIELTIPNEKFEKELFANLEKAEQLVFDYASLLNLSKMNLLGHLEKFNKNIYIAQELFDKIQNELLMFEQEDLRRLWHFLRTSKEIKTIAEYKSALKGESIDKLFNEWLINSMKLAKDKNAVFVVDDLRLLRFLRSEDIKGCNSFIILKAMRAKEWIDGKMYSLAIGDLAERFYTFIPFSGDDLFQIVMEDKSKIKLRTYHLVNQLLLPCSNAESFIKVFVKFIDLLWKTGALPEDKVKWLAFLTERILELIDNQGGVENNQELEKAVPDFVQIWIIAVQRSNRDEVAFLEKEADKILAKPYLTIFKDNIRRFIQAKSKTLISR
ncbi:MAG: helix-turn-helix domain-containing protein [Candidatus Omnitrophota bacterium]